MGKPQHWEMTSRVGFLQGGSELCAEMALRTAVGVGLGSRLVPLLPSFPLFLFLVSVSFGFWVSVLISISLRHGHTCTDTHTHAPTCTHTQHICTHITYTRACAHTLAHTHMHTRTRTYMHACPPHTHAHTYTCLPFCPGGLRVT